jgi:hypothetical protein
LLAVCYYTGWRQGTSRLNVFAAEEKMKTIKLRIATVTLPKFVPAIRKVSMGDVRSRPGPVQLEKPANCPSWTLRAPIDVVIKYAAGMFLKNKTDENNACLLVSNAGRLELHRSR